MWSCSPTARIHRFTHYYSELSTSKVFASHPLILRFCWTRGLSHKGRDAITRRHNDFIELEVMTAISHSEHLMLLNQQASKGVNVLTGAIGPDHQGEIGCFYTVEVMKSMSGIQETL